MASSPPLRESLRNYLFGELIVTEPERRPPDDANLFEHGLDSLRVMRLLVYIEEELGTRLPDHEITAERLSSVDSLATWIESHRQA